MPALNFEAGSEAQRHELAAKRERINQLLKAESLAGLVISGQNNFAWATGGANNWVSIAGEGGVASLVFRDDGSSYVITENIELPRMEEEEKLEELGFELIAAPWWEAAHRDKLLFDLASGHGKNARVGSDTPLAGAKNITSQLSQARWSLVPEERERYRQLGQAAGEALESTCLAVQPGMTEWQVAAQLAQASYERGMVPVVTLVAADERIFKYRHPIPTGRRIERYVMVVLCARAGGLIISCTRLVHFGPVPAEIQAKMKQTQAVDAAYILNTRPGVPAGQIFAQAQAAYARAGYPEEWRLHHQGGACGYAGRDYRAGPDSQEVVQEWQAFAWNPSITGTKSEDTILVSSEAGRELEILSRPQGSQWPVSNAAVEGLGAVERPDILER